MANKELLLKQRQQFIEENGVIFLDNVSKSYSKGVPAIDRINLRINPGEFVFIVGDRPIYEWIRGGMVSPNDLTKLFRI